MTKIWKIVSESPITVAIPDLGIYLEPNTSVEVLEDRAVWSRDLQEAMMLRKVRKEVSQLPVPLPTLLPAKTRPSALSGPSMAVQESEAHMVQALEKNNDLLQTIVDLLRTQQTAPVQMIVQQHHDQVAGISSPVHLYDMEKPGVFIPKMVKEDVEFGGEVAGETTVSDSEKSAAASKKLRELRKKK